MKTKLLITALFLSVIISQNTFSQLPNFNTRLLINLNQHPSGGNYSACWGYTAPNGREYAILGCQTGTAFVDITDTSNIHEVDFQPGGSTSWREMKTFSHYAYIVTDVSNGRGLQIIDLQYLPDSIHFVREWTFGSFLNGHTISQEGPYLYISGGNASTGGGIRVIDLTSNPENPVQRGAWTTRYVHDCRVKNDTIFACNINPGDGQITVINATNKDNLTTIASWLNNPSPGPHNCALTPDRKYCLVTDEINGNPRLLKIWDIQNLSNVTQVSTWQPYGITTTVVHNVEVYGYYAIIAHYEAGIRIVNISNPNTPAEVAWYDTYPSGNTFNYNGCWGVYMFPSGKIIGSDRQTGLYVIKTLFNIVVGAQNNQNNIPSKFQLNQNYPNPFNPTTRLKYSLPKGEYVTLKVFDVLGKQVGLLVDRYEISGEYSVTFDGARLSSGIYYYQIKAGDYTQTRKMILIK